MQTKNILYFFGAGTILCTFLMSKKSIYSLLTTRFLKYSLSIKKLNDTETSSISDRGYGNTLYFADDAKVAWIDFKKITHNTVFF